MFKRSFLFVFIPLAAIGLPFCFHQSRDPQIYTYSYHYYLFLIAYAVTAVLLSIVVAFICVQRKQLTLAYSFCAVILAVIAILGITETLLRWSHPDAFARYSAWGHRKSILFGYEAASNNAWKMAGATYHTDSHGFRSHTSDPEWDQKLGKSRMFVLGGSSAFGFGLNDRETWPELLERNIQKEWNDQHSIEIINAANNGHNSLQTLLRFYLKVLPLHPNYVIYYEAVNDIAAEALSPERISINDDILFSSTLAEYLGKIYKGKNLYRRSVLAYVLMRPKKRPSAERSINGKEGSLTKSEMAIQHQNADRFVQNVRTLLKICQMNGVRMILTTFLHDETHMPKNVSAAIREYNERLRDLSMKEEVILVDIERAFREVPDKPKYFYKDHYHLTVLGAEFIAATISHELHPLLDHA